MKLDGDNKLYNPPGRLLTCVEQIVLHRMNSAHCTQPQLVHPFDNTRSHDTARGVETQDDKEKERQGDELRSDSAVDSNRRTEKSLQEAGPSWSST